MDCRVVVEAAVPVYDVETADEAVRIAISKTGEMLNPDLNYVEIDMGERTCPECGHVSEPAFIAADEGLVALELEMTVFNVEREEHASRIARKEIGQRLSDIPLSILEVEIIADDAEETDEESTGETGSAGEGDGEAEAEAATVREGRGDEAGTRDGDDVLPDFDDLIE